MTFTRYELTIPVELTSELHIGGVDEVPDRDGEGTVIRFNRNGLKEPTIPGRSIRGAVRAACDVARQALVDAKDPTPRNGEAFSKETWISLWGDDTDYTGRSANDRGLPSDASLPIRKSALTFHAVSFPADQKMTTRHGVGIDRATGAASDGALYEHEFLPRGTRFNIRITAEGRNAEKMENEQSEGIPEPASSGAVKKLLELIVDILTSDTVSLGGRTGSGQGKIRVIEPKLRRISGTTDAGTLTAPADILDALIGQDEEGTPIPLELGGWSLQEPARITIHWWSPTGVFVAEDRKLTQQRQAKARAEGNPEAPEITEPLRDPSVDWEDAQLLIPGTSIRGTLRSRASRIARTVLAARGDLEPLASHDIHEQIAAEPNLVRYMFGCTEYRGAVTVHDCRSVEHGTRVEVTHNAIDRWTGGVVDGGLFTEAVYLGTEWEPITIDIDLRRLLENIETEKRLEATGNPANANEAENGSGNGKQSKATDADYAHAAFVLLGLALAELSAGTLPLGSRSTRGLGQVVVSSFDIRGSAHEGVKIPTKERFGDQALGHPGTAASPPPQDRCDAQRRLAGAVLGFLKTIDGAEQWSERLDEAPANGGARSKGEENTHE
nr:RAMP superfamily CRISPR-associated protein [Schaalia odontolytica]